MIGRVNSICNFFVFLIKYLGVHMKMRNNGRKENLNIKTCEKKEKNEVELIVEVDPEEFEAAMSKAFIKNKNRIAVPGFRKGKAPRKIIEKMYGAAIFHSDALDILLPEVLSFSLKETDLNIVGYPKISDVDIKADNAGADVTLIAAVHPEVVIGKYKGLSAPKPSVEVPDSEIDAEIATIRTRNARIEKADRPAADGDIAVIDFEGFVDGIAFDGGKGENYELELGSNTFIPGFEEKIVGMVVDEERDLDLVFPENYKEELAGKPVLFKVKLNEVKEKNLPELDDEFAKDVSEYDTLDEYKASIKDRLLKARQKDVDETFENILLDQVTETLEADIPDAMVDEQVETSMSTFMRQMSAYGMEPEQYMRMTGLTPDEFKEKMRGSSEKQVKVTLVLEKIAELEGIEVSETEIDDEYADAAERYNMDVEKLKESVARDDIKRDLKLRGAAKIVVDSAIVEEFSEDDKPAVKKPAAKKPATKKPAAKKAAEEKPKADEEKE